MIDKTGNWWTGDSFDDLRTFAIEFTAANLEPAELVVPSVCSCGATAFGLRVDDGEGCASRHCPACGTDSSIADSEEHWDDADPGDAACPCGQERFEVGTAFTLRDDGDVRWVTVAGRCTICGVLGADADWSIDYSPTDHLLTAT